MASLTDNKYDVYNWITKVIDSCNNYHHFRAAGNIITNFDKAYDDWQLTGKLRGYSSDKYYTTKDKQLLKG
jgi:hypothetical protein